MTRFMKKIFLRDKGCYRSRDSPLCGGNSGGVKKKGGSAGIDFRCL